MNELVAKIKELSNAFFMDAELQTEKGNKAAGTRARKASLELEKLLKEFRKASLEEAKKWSAKRQRMMKRQWRKISAEGCRKKCRQKG